MISTLYITRNGLLEPLGQSQVMAYLRGLSRGRRITLITYEKPEDWSDPARMARARAECKALGIRWLPQRFLAQPKLIAPGLSLLRMVWLVWREARASGARLIHARSYIPAAAALIAGGLSGTPFIFDMRALWPEELITAGRLRRGSLLHRAIVSMERICLRRAAAVVSLTNAAADYLAQAYPNEMAGQRVVVIPTCADLDRFKPARQAPSGRILGCMGTLLSGWFRLDWLAAFFAAAARCDPELAFQITTRDDPDAVRAAFAGCPETLARLNVGSCAPQAAPHALQAQMASVMFFTEGLAKLGSSPTRMGEALGCGLPVVANEGVGDVARIVREYRVGVLARGPGGPEMERTWQELNELLADPDLPARCRKAAEEVFSLHAGAAAYSRLYDEITVSSTISPSAAWRKRLLSAISRDTSCAD